MYTTHGRNLVIEHTTVATQRVTFLKSDFESKNLQMLLSSLQQLITPFQLTVLKITHTPFIFLLSQLQCNQRKEEGQLKQLSSRSLLSLDQVLVDVRDQTTHSNGKRIQHLITMDCTLHKVWSDLWNLKV